MAENENWTVQISDKFGDVMINSRGNDVEKVVANYESLKKKFNDKAVEDASNEIVGNQSREVSVPFVSEGETCPVCRAGIIKRIPAGVSTRTGKAYPSFLACPNKCSLPK